MNSIQGYNAVLSLYKNSWLPFVCGSDITIDIQADKIPVRTVGDGVWKKFAYQALAYTIRISGVLVFDDVNFSQWDMLDNQMNFSEVNFLITFDDENGDVMSLQGTAIVDGNNISISAGSVVKSDISLSGTGLLMLFEGTVPCPTVITGITVGGTTSSTGTASVTYTYTGDLYQVMYQIDNTGSWTYINAGLTITVPGLAIGNHTITLIPICLNGYEGDPVSQTFTMTLSLACTSVVTGITVTGTGPCSALPTYTGSATQVQYIIDGGSPIFWPITTPVYMNLPIGAHTIEMIPICSNGALGTGFTQSFNVTTSGTYSNINWSLVNIPGGVTLSIYKDGVLLVNESNNASGSFTAVTSDLIKVYLNVNFTVTRAMNLEIEDTTTSVVITNQNLNSTPNVNSALQFTFTPNVSDTYQLTNIVTP